MSEDSKAVESKIPTTFDFGDGNGPVPAHRHENGGGWVADTAYVEDSVYVGLNALVYGAAGLCDKVALLGDSRVYGDAYLRGDISVDLGVRVCGKTQLWGDLFLYEGVKMDRTPVIVTELFGDLHESWSAVLISSPKRLVAIGCEVHPPEHWRKHAREIARKHGAQRGSVPKLMALLNLVYGKPRAKRAKIVKKK